MSAMDPWSSPLQRVERRACLTAVSAVSAGSRAARIFLYSWRLGSLRRLPGKGSTRRCNRRGHVVESKVAVDTYLDEHHSEGGMFVDGLLAASGRGEAGFELPCLDERTNFRGLENTRCLAHVDPEGVCRDAAHIRGVRRSKSLEHPIFGFAHAGAVDARTHLFRSGTNCRRRARFSNLPTPLAVISACMSVRAAERFAG